MAASAPGEPGFKIEVCGRLARLFAADVAPLLAIPGLGGEHVADGSGAKIFDGLNHMLGAAGLRAHLHHHFVFAGGFQ